MKVFNCLYSLGIVDVDVKIEQELPSKTISGGSTHSTGNGDFEVSDDDYTSEFMEMSSKRRRRETRLGFLLCFFHLMISCSTSCYMSYFKRSIFNRRKDVYLGRKSN